MKNEPVFGYYFLIIIDLLGQKDHYKKIEHMPADAKNKESQFYKDVVEAVRSIEALNKYVDGFFTGLSSVENTFQCPPEYEKFKEKSEKKICRVQRFSDLLVLYVPLADDPKHIPIQSVHTALVCCASLFFLLLADKKPIRGGIAIAPAFELGENEIFGPALSKAHEMESKIAKYPRIAIDETVINYIQQHRTITLDDAPETSFVNTLADRCLKMLDRDVDGVVILDYLGEYLWEESISKIQPKLIENAEKFSSEQWAKFQKEGKSELAMRYFLLSSYIHNKKPK